MMNEYKTACVILNYNDASTTLDLLRKIQHYKVLNYIVIVDNCSTDDSIEKIQQYVSNNIYLLKSSSNGGYGAGNNIGIRYAYNTLKSD